MISLVAIFVLASPSEPPRPPYKRVATELVESTQSYLVSGNTLFLGYDGKCVALDLKSFKKRWEWRLPKRDEPVVTLAISGDTLFACTRPPYGRKASSLLALDARTGKKIWSLPRKGTASALAVDDRFIYVSMTPSLLSALDRKTRRARWIASLGKPNPNTPFAQDVEAVVVDQGRVAANYNNTTFCFDVASGKQLWKENGSYILDQTLLSAKGVIWVPTGQGAVARDLRTGAVLWRDPKFGYGDGGAVLGSFLVGLDAGQARALNPRTGKAVWSHPVGPEDTSGGNQYVRVLGSAVFVRGIKTAGIYDLKGNALWTGEEASAIEAPCWTDGKSLVTFSAGNLTRYERGTTTPIPTDGASRQAEAARLVAQFDKLDGAETKRLEGLGDDAFPALLKAFLDTCALYDKAEKAGGNTYPIYSKFHDIGGILMKVATKKRAAELTEVLRKLPSDSSAKPVVMTLLAQHGDPNQIVPLFLKELEGFKTPGFEMYESNTYVARSYIAASPHPSAIKYMIGQLGDPKGDETLRQEAYWNLARTGGEEGLKAVLAERGKRKLLRPLVARLELEKAEPQSPRSRAVSQILSEKKDSEGRTWCLFKSGMLGSRGDLWVVEKTGSGWGKPAFLGVSMDGPSSWAKGAKEPKIAGKTGKEVAAGAWLDLVHNSAIWEDQDGDGLSDLVEKRLGTDPRKADTDGDGDRDDVDPWPNAAPRAMSDDEKVMAAVFEARYHFYDWEGPALFFAPKSMKPFEMVGWIGPTLWLPEGDTRDWATPLEQCYEQGIAFLSMRGSGNQIVEWNASHTEASVSISTYYGGLAGDGYSAVVRKFGDEWVVVSLRMAYIS